MIQHHQGGAPGQASKSPPTQTTHIPNPERSNHTHSAAPGADMIKHQQGAAPVGRGQAKMHFDESVVEVGL